MEDETKKFGKLTFEKLVAGIRRRFYSSGYAVIGAMDHMGLTNLTMNERVWIGRGFKLTYMADGTPYLGICEHWPEDQEKDF